MEPTKAELYCATKGWTYGINGNQLVLQACPFCGRDKFYINKDNFLWDCKSGNCGKKGNEKTLKYALGDAIEGIESQHDNVQAANKPAPLPDVEAAHDWLLQNDKLMNFLNDDRGWSEATVRKMKLGLGTKWIHSVKQMVPCLMYPYFAGEHCVFVKYRTLPPAEKDFAATGGRENGLYNQNAVKKDMEYLLLVEGEADTISVIEQGELNVAGIPGCESKKVTFDHLLTLPKKKYLLFDNDAAGQHGAEEFANRFGVSEFYNIVLPEFDLSEPVGDRTKGKDISEWLLEGYTLADLKVLMDQATPFEMEGVSGMAGALEDCIKEMEEKGNSDPRYNSPWPSLNRCMGGMEDGDLVIIQAAQKCGKTTMALNWVDYLVTQFGVNCFVECLEMSQARLARKWASFVTKTDDTPGRSELTAAKIREAITISRDRPNEILFGYTTLKREEDAFERIRKAVRRYGVKVVVFDNLQFLVDVTLTKSQAGNRVSYMSQLTKKFKSLAMELKIVILLIAQTKRLDEDTVATSNSLEGSSAPANDCDTMLVMNRSKEANVRKKSELSMMGNMQTSENYAPELYIKTDLSRFAPGGWATLHMQGEMSWIRERTTDEEGKSGPKDTANGIPFEKQAAVVVVAAEEGVQAI